MKGGPVLLIPTFFALLGLLIMDVVVKFKGSFPLFCRPGPPFLAAFNHTAGFWEISDKQCFRRVLTPHLPRASLPGLYRLLLMWVTLDNAEASSTTLPTPQRYGAQLPTQVLRVEGGYPLPSPTGMENQISFVLLLECHSQQWPNVYSFIILSPNRTFFFLQAGKEMPLNSLHKIGVANTPCYPTPLICPLTFWTWSSLAIAHTWSPRLTGPLYTE